MKFSIVIPCKNEGENIKMTVDSILNSSCKSEKEIIVVDDASEDDCCKFLNRYKGIKLINSPGLGAARARNHGARYAKHDVIVFCDAHIIVEDGWLDKLAVDFERDNFKAVSPAIAVLGNCDQVGYGQRWDSNLENKWLTIKPAKTDIVPLLPGGCMAVAKNAFEFVEGFNEYFEVWGHEDEEISLKLWLLGFPCAVNPDIVIQHLFRPRHPYEVEMYNVHYNLLIMAISHFKNERTQKIKEKVKKMPYYSKLIKNIEKSGIWEQRKKLFSKRLYDDDWFMKKFKINF